MTGAAAETASWVHKEAARESKRRASSSSSSSASSSSSSHRQSRRCLASHERRARVLLLTSRARGTQTQPICGTAHAAGAFEARMWEKRGAAFLERASVAGKQKERNRRRFLCIPSSRARAVLALARFFLAHRTSTRLTCLSRERRVGRKRRRRRGKKARVFIFFLEEETEKPFARRGERGGDARGKGLLLLPPNPRRQSPCPLPLPAAAANSNSSFQ